jgi:hypothetical protein
MQCDLCYAITYYNIYKLPDIRYQVASYYINIYFKFYDIKKGLVINDHAKFVNE